MEQKRSNNRKLPALIAAVLVVALAATVTTITVLNQVREAPQPALYFEGVTLRPVMDAAGETSIQALVDVYAEDVRYLNNVQFYATYDSSYWVPSDMETNEAVSGVTRRFFGVPDELYDGRNPYYVFGEGSTTVTQAVNAVETAQQTLYLLLSTRNIPETEIDNWPEAGQVKRFFVSEDSGLEEGEGEEGEPEGGSSGPSWNLYIDAQGKKVNVVTLSFRVNEDKLAEMVDIFEGKQSPLGVIDGKYLLQLQTRTGSAPGGGRTMVAAYDWPNTEAVSNPVIYSLIGKNLTTSVAWTFPERPVKLVSSERDVTVNAYQAYTDATVADIVRTLQKYSPTARATYSSGKEEDILLYWGGDEGCYIMNQAGEQRLFRWTKDAAGDYDGGYELLKWDDTAGDWVPETGSWYDPTGGVYTVQQYVDYPWEGTTRRYEYPVQVNLTVTPVTATGVTANNLYKSYANPNVPDNYDALELADEALIITDVVTGSGSLTINIDSWTPDYTDDMSTITGIRTEPGGGTTAVTWTDTTDDNNVGIYTFDAVPEFTAAAIQRVYPWLTVTRDYAVQAVREIADAARWVDDTLYEVVATRNDETGVLTLEVRKRLPDGTGYDVMPDNTTFRVKIPNGTLLDTAWFNNTNGGRYSYPDKPVPYTVNGETVSTYPIAVEPGYTTGSYLAEREMVRRAINLGGYFEVEVTEPDKVSSSFLPAYIGPRKNIYLASYTIVDGSAETATVKNAFDFRGDRAGLLSLYRDRKLGTIVVLPYGSEYSVATRYDGMTGAEPGKVHTVVVDAWTKETALGDGGWSGTQWTGTVPITVQYGADLFARRAVLTGFGTVENEDVLTSYRDRQVTILAQVGEEAPQESLRLTYEETGASVRLTANGEVDEVRFDPRQVGYTYNQMVTLTLTNTGDTDIRGLYLDTGALEGLFRVINPPATELPAGASTTFTLSYQLGLDKGIYSTKAENVPLKVFSASGERKQFDAYLKVTDQPLWRVTVRSEDDAMGGGRLVEGVADGTLNETAAPNIYETGEKVWVLAEPKGEYTVGSAYYYNKEGVKVTLAEHTPVVTADGKVLFSFDMPAQNVVVYISFRETTWAKLRLELLRVDAGPTDDSLTWKLPLYKADDYKVIQATEDEVPDLSAPDYLVIIGAEDDRVQLKVKLRDILKGTPPLSADVKMTLNYEGDIGTDVTVYDYLHTPGETDPLLDHASALFDAPLPGRTVTAFITITAEEDGVTVKRDYTVKIARRPTDDDPAEYPLYPGNSPYGMIDGDATITDKTAAKAAFNVEDRFDAAYTPARAGDLTNTYWTEAWAGTNYDRDPAALFVYLGEPFDDPGPEEVRNTARDVVDVAEVSRSVTVTLLDLSKPSPTQAEQFAGAGTVTLELGTADVVRVADWWKDKDGTDYSGQIRPGIYSLTYTFTDVDGAELTFTRPLIILSRNGDVTLDGGAAGSPDAAAIEGRLGSSLGHEAAGYPDSRLFLYRVCDANNDRNLNNVDANAIRGGKCVTYYLPTEYNDFTAPATP